MFGFHKFSYAFHYVQDVFFHFLNFHNNLKKTNCLYVLALQCFKICKACVALTYIYV